MIRTDQSTWKTNSLIVNISFVVLFFHVEVRTLAFLDKAWNGFFVLDCSLSEVKSDFGQHVLKLFNNFFVSESFVDFDFHISDFNSFRRFLDPEVATSFSDIDQLHANGIPQDMFDISSWNHGHKFIGTKLDQRGDTEVISKQNQAFIGVSGDISRQNQPIGFQKVEEYLISDSRLLAKNARQNDLFFGRLARKQTHEKLAAGHDFGSVDGETILANWKLEIKQVSWFQLQKVLTESLFIQLYDLTDSLGWLFQHFPLLILQIWLLNRLSFKNKFFISRFKNWILQLFSDLLIQNSLSNPVSQIKHSQHLFKFTETVLILKAFQKVAQFIVSIEVLVKHSCVHIKLLIVHCFNAVIGMFFVVNEFQNMLFLWCLVNLVFRLWLVYTNVMQVIEVLTVESTKCEHWWPDESCAMATSCGWCLACDFQLTNGAFFKIRYQKIIQIVTETAAENIDFVIVDSGRVAPSC